MILSVGYVILLPCRKYIIYDRIMRFEKVHIMLIAVTGTPGTGKSSACKLLSEFIVIDLNELIKRHANLFQSDAERDSLEVDPKHLKKLLPKMKGTLIIEGHLAHLLDPDITIVLRCSPKTLGKRLSLRGWSDKKIRENQEAEAVDVILIEAMNSKAMVFEIDTSKMKPKGVADAIREIIAGERRKYKPGNIDWSKEVLAWY